MIPIIPYSHYYWVGGPPNLYWNNIGIMEKKVEASIWGSTGCRV